MKWTSLAGKTRPQPDDGTWKHWKQVIADFCEGRCVYCAIPEARFGGIRNYHIEHYRPKSKFPTLENSIHNLYLACSICNVLKCDDWPAEPADDHSLAAYPDPYSADYNSLFTISETHELSSSLVAGQYIIERLLLNRAQLIFERRLAAALRFGREYREWFLRSLDQMTVQELRDMATMLVEISTAAENACNSRPYRDVDTKRTTSRAAMQGSR